MRLRFLFVFIVMLGLVACAGMPTWTAGGDQPPPPIDEPDATPDDAVADPIVGDEVDVGDILTTVAPLLPAPWGWLVPLIGVTVVALTRKGK